MGDIEFISGEAELLDHISALWESLNELHGTLSPHFHEAFEKRTFHDRKEELIAKSQVGRLRIDIACTRGQRKAIGYCVSTVDREGNGEIDSIFVEESYRHRGIARQLMTSATSWLESLGVNQKRVVVAFGNDEVLSFYTKFGFYPRSFTLFHKPSDPLG